MKKKDQKWPDYEAYLASEEWAKLRKIALDRAKHRCQLCYSDDKLHVHHRVYDSAWGEESTDDLTVLCISCHAMFHNKELKKQQAKKNPVKPAVNKPAVKKKTKKKAKPKKERQYKAGVRLTKADVADYTTRYGLPRLLE